MPIIGVPGGGVWGRVEVGGGGWFSDGQEGKGEGGGVWTGKGTGKSMRTSLSKLAFSKLPFSFPPKTVAENFGHFHASCAVERGQEKSFENFTAPSTRSSMGHGMTVFFVAAILLTLHTDTWLCRLFLPTLHVGIPDQYKPAVFQNGAWALA